MSLFHTGPSAVTTAEEVYSHYTGADAAFYVDGENEPVTEIWQNADGTFGALVDGEVITLNAQDAIYLVNPDRVDGEQ